jgi:inosose dehydratase
MIQFGIAPIGWTNDDMPELGGNITFEQSISEMALAGYAGCEVGNKFPVNDLPLLKHQLELRKLRICNQWFSFELTKKPFDLVKNDFEKHIQFLHFFGTKVSGGAECGNTIHGNPNIPIHNRKPASTQEWNLLSKGLNELGRFSLEEYGIKLSYHHHIGTMVESDEEVERLMNETHPEYVGLNYDCGHFALANEDAVAAFEKYHKRVSHIHLKDIRGPIKDMVDEQGLSFLDAVRKGVFTVPGDGNLPIDSIINLISKKGYDGWVVVEAEQDPALANPLEYAIKGLEYLKKQFI